MTNVGYATLTVSPSLRGMQQSMRGQLGAIMPAAGQRAGRQLGQGINAGTRTGMGRIAGAMSAVTAAAGNVANNVRSRFATATGDASRGVTGIGSSFRAMGSMAAVGLAAVGLGNFTRDIYQTASGAQSTEAVLRSMYSAAGHGAGESQKMMNLLNQEFSRSAIEMTAFQQGAQDLAYMGLTASETTSLLGDLEQMLVATGGTSEDMGAVTDALLKMQNQGKSTMNEINTLTQRNIPILDMLADKFGTDVAGATKMVEDGLVDVEDVLGALEEQGGTWASALIEGGENVAGTFSGAWASIKNTIVNGIARQVIPLLDNLAPKMVSLGERIHNAFEALPAAISRVKSAMDRLGITGALRDIYDAAVALAKGAAPMISGFAAGVGGALGALLVALRPVARLLRTVGDWMQDNAETVRAFGAAIGVATVAWRAYRIAQWAANAAMAANPIGIVVVALAALVATLVAAIVWAYRNSETFRDIVQGTWSVVQTVVTTVVGIVTAVIAHLRDETTLLGGIWQTVWTGIQEHFGIIWGAIVEAWNSGVQIFQGMWDILQGILEGDWQRAWNGAKDVALGAWNLLTLGIRTMGSIIWNYLQTFFVNLPQNVGTWLQENVPVIVENLAAWWEAFRTWIIETTPKIIEQLVDWGTAIANWLANDAPDAIIGGAVSLWENHLKPWFEDLPDKITTAFNNVQRFQEWMAEYGPTLLRGLGIAVLAVITGIPALIAGVGAAIVTALGVISGSIVSSLTSHLRRAASEAFASMQEKASEQATKLVSWFRELPGRIYDAVSRVVGQMKTLGKNIITGIINGVTGAAGDLYTRLRDIAGNALSAARRALGIRSPSREFRDHVGAEIVAGFIEGITRGQRDVDAAIQGMVSARPIARTLPVPVSPEVRRHQSNQEHLDMLHEIATALRERDGGDFVVSIDSQEIARANRRGERQLGRR